MMPVTIFVEENSIVAGNTDKVRRTLEPIVENSDMVRRYEAGLALSFGPAPGKRPLGFFDLEKRLSQPSYKHWFRRMDREVPALPYFLAADDPGKSLLIYLMGVLDYKLIGERVTFDAAAMDVFFHHKKTEIKNLCLSNNISPLASIQRLADLLAPAARSDGPVATPPPAAAPPAKEERPDTDRPAEAQLLKQLLDRFGSIAVLKENRMTKLFVVFDEIPPQIRLVRNELVLDRSLNRWFFRTVFLIDGRESARESLLLYRPNEVTESIQFFNGALIMCVYRDETSEYQKLFETDEPVRTDIVEQAGHAVAEVSGGQAAPDGPADEGTTGQASPPPAAAPEPAPQAAPADPKDARIAELEAEVAKLKNIVEAYEETLLGKNKKSIFKKFFG